MNSILIPESLLHEKTYNADKYFNERFPSDYATMEANPNYSESGCGIAVTASDTENTLSIKDPADSSKELCKLTYSNGKLKFTYKKPAMVNNITMVGVGSTEKLNILDNNFDILHLNVVKKLGGAHVPNTSFDNLASVCYGNGKFVAIGDSSNVFAYSTDGATWTQGTMPSEQGWHSVCYGNGKFIAISTGMVNTSNYSDVFAYSTDGISWTEGTMPSKQSWISVCYGNGKFIAISNGMIDSPKGSDVFAYSTDGITWTKGNLPSKQAWTSVCYGDNKFVAISYGAFAYSTDGITWTEDTTLNGRPWISVCYGNGKYVAVVYRSNEFAYSTDGITWTTGNMSVSSQWMSVCYGNGKYVAVTYNDASIMFAYSYNGYKWYTVALDQSLYKDGIYHNYSSVCYSPDHNFFVTVNSPTIISIPDAYAGGVCNTFAVEYSWSGSIPSGVTLPNPTSYTSGATVTVDTRYTSSSIELPSVTVSYPTVPANKSWITYYGNGKWIGVDKTSDNSTVLTSTDGITWTQNSESLPIRAYSICYGSGKFVVFSSTQNYVYSTDGITWTSNTLPNSKYYESLCYGNGKFVALSSDATTAIYSTDGISWTSKATNLTNNGGKYGAGCYGNGKYVFIGEGTKQVIYSTDGITWKTATLPSQSSWEGICYGNGKFVASAQVNDYCAYSTDGITWTNAKIERLTGDYGKDSAWSCAYGSGLFVINSYNCKAYWLSTDGINWSRHEFDGVDDWYYVKYGNGKFIIATSSGLQGKFACLTVPDTYYQFSGWSKSGTFNITSDTSITGSWSKKSKLSVTYSWTNAPTGMTSTVPVKVTGLMPNETVAVDSKYTNKSAYKDTTNKKYYKFSGWNKSGEFNISSNTSISGSWDNGTSVNDAWTTTYFDATDVDDTYLDRVGSTYGCYGNGVYVVIAGYSTNYYLMYSTNGTSWNVGYTTTTSIQKVCYGNGKFVATMFTSNYVLYSTNGKSWSKATVSSTNRKWYPCKYCNGYYIIIESKGQYFAYSTNATSWTEVASGFTSEYYDIAYGAGKYVAISHNSMTNRYSTNLTTWTSSTIGSSTDNWNAIIYENNIFVAISNTKIMYSTDGLSWTQASSLNDFKWRGLVYTGSKFIVTNYNPTCMFAISDDGKTWETEAWTNHTITAFPNSNSSFYGNGIHFLTSELYDSDGGFGGIAYKTDWPVDLNYVS